MSTFVTPVPPRLGTEPQDEPCLPIQIDLSAMLDGELDPASVRRVMVHSDVCPACKAFLRGIRTQLRAHRDLSAMLDPRGAGIFDRRSAAVLRRKLMENRERLARILYELGRGFVLMGVSPKFSRVVAQEPVPIPDLCVRGRNLLDEVDRLAEGRPGAEWVRAKRLFDAQARRSPAENMAKGMRLLREALMLHAGFHEARIYLGHALTVLRQMDDARAEFGTVLSASSDPLVRAFALENLGIAYMEERRYGEAIRHFLDLVDSGVVKSEPRFFTSYFNLAVSHGMLRQFDDCGTWLGRLHGEFPHKRRVVGVELRSRSHFAAVLAEHAAIEAGYAARFPEWFPLPKGGS
jgi:tetratricopeptide (TPR) repeat protein